MPSPLKTRWHSLLAEGLAVLAGVLSAFAIDAWWDARGARLQERSYLSALRDEMVATRGELTAHRELMTGRMRAARDMLSLIANREVVTVSSDTITTLLYQLGPFVNFTPRRAVLDDLINSGGIQLIRADPLRRALAAYERTLAEDYLAQEEVREFWRLELSPFHNEHGNLRGMITEGRVGADIVLPELGFQPERSAYLSQQHANLMVHRLLLTQRVRERHDEVLGIVERIVALIDSTLAGT
jgi:hypothetical protein